jgi:hypothetical protein
MTRTTVRTAADPWAMSVPSGTQAAVHRMLSDSYPNKRPAPPTISTRPSRRFGRKVERCDQRTTAARAKQEITTISFRQEWRRHPDLPPWCRRPPAGDGRATRERYREKAKGDDRCRTTRREDEARSPS